MDIRSVIKIAEKFTIDNSPSILTAFGVVGTIATAVLSYKAGYKNGINHAVKGVPEKKKDRVANDIPRMVPAIGVGALAVVSIIGANRIGGRRAAAMAAAYSISERAFAEYKDKVVEKIGEKKATAVRDELAQDKVDKKPASKAEIFVTGGGEVLCFDSLTGRYFMSSMETLKKAENDINYQILHDNYASLTDFYKKIGLVQTVYSEEVGWNLDQLLELAFSTTMSDDNKPCISIGYNNVPIRGFHRLQ